MRLQRGREPQRQRQQPPPPRPLPAGAAALDAPQLAAWAVLAGRLHERLLAAALAFLDNHPAPFSQYVAHFLALYVDGALVAADAAALRGMRAKRRVLLVRFIAKVRGGVGRGAAGQGGMRGLEPLGARGLCVCGGVMVLLVRLIAKVRGGGG